MNNKSTIKWISAIAGRKKSLIFLLILTHSFLGLCGVWYALLLKSMIDSAISSHMDDFRFYTTLFIFLVILQIIIRAIERFTVEYTRSSLENTYKSRLFSTLMKKDFSDVTKTHSGEWINRLTNDTVVVADAMTHILPGIAGMVIKMAGALIAILILAPMFGWLIVPGGLLMLLLSYAFRKVLKRLHKVIQEKDGKLRVFFQEHLQSLMIVKTFGVWNRINNDSIVKMNEHKKARLHRNRFSNVCNIGLGIIMHGAYVSSAICCLLGIIAGTMTYGTLMAILQLISQIQSPFANITGYIPRYYAMLASAERLMEADALTDETNTDVYSSKEIYDFYHDNFVSIGFDNISFSYRKDSPIVLNNLSLDIKKGDYVAFTGMTGCGKSTILKLFMCLYAPNNGQLYLNTIEKQSSLSPAWRKLFAYVPQGNHLMSGSIRDIVAFGDIEDASNDKRIWDSLRIACADEFVRKLENDIDTILGEHGLGLSEGQMQRIAIARAIFSGNPILMLDEATSALDEETEMHLLSNLRSMTDKTVLIITHRMNVLSICDKVIEM